MKKTILSNKTLAFFLILFSFSFVNAQKISVGEVVTKHLESIGNAKQRSEITNQLIVADVNVSQKGGTIPISGRGLFLSTNEKNLWGMNLASNDYPQDRFGFDGKKTRIGYTKPAVRSMLGDFIFSYNELLNQSLLGGTLLNSWVLLKPDFKGGNISYEGTKKIDGKETHVISFSPKNGSDLSIRMFFDQQNFQHLRTEYNRVIGARQGTNVDNSAGQGEDRYKLVEDFSNYSKMGNLTLPGKYKITYSYSSSSALRVQQKRNVEITWNFDVKTFSFNQPLDESSFDIEGK